MMDTASCKTSRSGICEKCSQMIHAAKTYVITANAVDVDKTLREEKKELETTSSLGTKVNQDGGDGDSSKTAG